MTRFSERYGSNKAVTSLPVDAEHYHFTVYCFIVMEGITLNEDFRLCTSGSLTLTLHK